MVFGGEFSFVWYTAKVSCASSSYLLYDACAAAFADTHVSQLHSCLLLKQLSSTSQVGGTFWLTRLARDREASVRATALLLLAHLAGPEAVCTRRMLLQGWPEAGSAVLKVFTQSVVSCTQEDLMTCSLVY